MPARDKVLNFEKFAIGFCSIADRDPRHMLVWSRDDGLVKKRNRYGNGLCIRFKLWQMFKLG
jgi:hypothetical protein